MNKNFLTGLMGVVLLACQPQSNPQGERLYTYYCANCHMPDGDGVGELYPPIQGSDYLNTRANELPCLIINGRAGSILKTVAMPANLQLTEAEMYNLVNFIHAKWGDGRIVNLPELRQDLSSCSALSQ